MRIALVALSLAITYNQLKSDTSIIARKGTLQDWDFVTDLSRTTYIPLLSEIKQQLPINVRKEINLMNARKYTNRKLLEEKQCLIDKKIECVIFYKFDDQDGISTPIGFISFSVFNDKENLAFLIRYSIIPGTNIAELKKAFLDYLATEHYQNLSYLLAVDYFPGTKGPFKKSYSQYLHDFGFELSECLHNFGLRLVGSFPYYALKLK